MAYEKKPPPRPDIGIYDDLLDILNLCWTQDSYKRPKIQDISDSLRALFPPDEARQQQSSQTPRHTYDVPVKTGASDRVPEVCGLK